MPPDPSHEPDREILPEWRPIELEPDLLACDLTSPQRVSLPHVDGRSRDLLECLSQLELPFGHRFPFAFRPAPRPRGVCGDDPEIDLLLAEGRYGIRLPFAHVETVGCDPRARLEFPKQPRAEFEIDVAPHVDRHHGGLPEIGREDVRHDESDAVLHAGLLRCPEAVIDQIGVDLDAYGAAARLPGGLDDDAAVAGAEIVEDVVLSHAGLRKDLRDDIVGGRYEGGVELDVALGFRVGMGDRYGDEAQEEG